MTYAEKLRDPRWQKKRLQIFDRDGWQCLFCGSKEKNLQVHHAVYMKRDPWDYPDHLYQTLCEDCHEQRQQLTDKYVSAVRISLMNVPNKRLLDACQKLCESAMLKIELNPVKEGGR